MTQDPRKISEADLHAYADGELEAEARLEVEAYLREHPEVARQVEEWQQQNEALQQLFGPVADEPVPEALDPARLAAAIGHAPAARGWADWRAMAAGLALLITGASAGWFGHGAWGAGGPPATGLMAERPMVRQALAAHTTYVNEVLHPVDVRGDDEKHLVAWLSKRLQVPVKAPKLAQNGFTLVGGSLLPREEGMAAQLMYEDGQGQRITLYQIRNQKAETSSFRFASYKAMNAFYWLDSDKSYVLVGNLDKQALSPLAHAVFAQL